MLLKIYFILTVIHFSIIHTSIITSKYHVLFQNVEFAGSENAFKVMDNYLFFLSRSANLEITGCNDTIKCIIDHNNVAALEKFKIGYEETKQKAKVIGMLEKLNRKPIPINQFQNCSQTNILTFILGPYCWLNFTFFKEALKSNHGVIEIEKEKHSTPVSIKHKSLSVSLKKLQYEFDRIDASTQYYQYMYGLVTYFEKVVLDINLLIAMYEDIVTSSKNGKPSKYIFPISILQIIDFDIDEHSFFNLPTCWTDFSKDNSRIESIIIVPIINDINNYFAVLGGMGVFRTYTNGEEIHLSTKQKKNCLVLNNQVCLQRKCKIHLPSLYYNGKGNGFVKTCLLLDNRNFHIELVKLKKIIQNITVDCPNSEKIQYQVNSTSLNLHVPYHCQVSNMYFSIEALYSKNITDLSRFINESIQEIKIKEDEDIEDLSTFINESTMEIKLKEDKLKIDFEILKNDMSSITVDLPNNTSIIVSFTILICLGGMTVGCYLLYLKRRTIQTYVVTESTQL